MTATYWVLSARCGCPWGLVSTVVAATREAARRQVGGTADDVLDLVSLDQYRHEIAPLMSGPCPHGRQEIPA